jgi:hypothetical protein
MVEIVVELPPDRRFAGRLTLKDDQGRTLAGPFDAYGKADNAAAIAHGNAGRDPKLPYGDTPEGSYEVPRAIATGDDTNYPAHSYGNAGALALRPVGGPALDALANGRIGLLIHGGDPGLGGTLRPTNGCVRLSNADMASLITGLENAGTAGTAPICSTLSVTANVTEGAPDDGEDNGDPPPNIDEILNGTASGPIIWHP